MRHDKSADARDLVAFDNAPYPFPADGTIPETGERFFSTDEQGLLFHLAPRGGKLFEHPTYDDRRSLVVVPRRFDPSRPAAIVLFFHGNAATLSRDVVHRQRVVEQVERSGLNAVLVAPQLAVDALDSSPGRFYQPGFFDAYLAEAAVHLAAHSGGRLSLGAIDAMPVILVAYSGGYLATAYCLPEQSHTRRRILGIVLLDALFGEEPKFADRIVRARNAFFVSAYSPSSAGLNAKLAADLEAGHIQTTRELPSSLRDGEVVLLDAPDAVHNDFVTSGWAADPLRKMLSRVDLGWGAGGQRGK